MRSSKLQACANLARVIDVCYAQSGDVSIAYQVVGDGPIDLVFVAGAITNLEVLWEDPDYRRFCERLGTFSRLLLFDKRGMGLSDRVRVGTLEERMDDVRAVMDAVGSESAALMGVSEGGPLSMLFAAAQPERTRALILCGAEVKEERTDDWPWGESTRAEFEQALDPDRVAARWGKGFAAEHIFPNRRGDEAFRRWFGRLQVQSATPKDAVAFIRMAFEIDVRHVVPSISVPTLIIHRTDDPVCHVENARWLARHVDGARYLELAGNDHAPWIDRDEILAETQEFLTGVRSRPSPTACSPPSCSRTSSDRQNAPEHSATVVGATCSSATILSFEPSWLATADARLTRPGTASSLPSTAPREASAARARSWTGYAGSGSRYGQGCTPARSSWPPIPSAESPSTQVRASPHSHGQARSSSPAPSKTSSPDRASSSSIAGATS